MAKYSPGNPVWVKSDGRNGNAGKEYAAVIIQYNPWYTTDTEVWYYTNILAFPCDNPYGWVCKESLMRPRRDDYQQHEGLGSRSDIDNLVYYDDTVEA